MKNHSLKRKTMKMNLTKGKNCGYSLIVEEKETIFVKK